MWITVIIIIIILIEIILSNRNVLGLFNINDKYPLLCCAVINLMLIIAHVILFLSPGHKLSLENRS